MAPIFFCREKHKKPLASPQNFPKVICVFQALPWSFLRGNMVFFWWGGLGVEEGGGRSVGKKGIWGKAIEIRLKSRKNNHICNIHLISDHNITKLFSENHFSVIYLDFSSFPEVTSPVGQTDHNHHETNQKASHLVVFRDHNHLPFLKNVVIVEIAIIFWFIPIWSRDTMK